MKITFDQYWKLDIKLTHFTTNTSLQFAACKTIDIQNTHISPRYSYALVVSTKFGSNLNDINSGMMMIITDFHEISVSIWRDRPGGLFKKWLNRNALQILPVYKLHIFQCMGKIFCVEFQRYPLKFHTKFVFVKIKNLRATSLYLSRQFWNGPQANEDRGRSVKTPRQG